MRPLASGDGSRAGDGLFVQSFARGLAVIEAFDAEHPRLTLAEAAARTGFSRAVVRRFLHTLIELGFAGSDGRAFWLTPRVLRLGFSYLAGQPLVELATPVLERLSAAVGESASASVLDGADVVYVARVQTRRIMHVAITVGTRFPAGVTSMGRVLLAGLEPQRAAELLAAEPLPLLTPRTLTDPAAVAALLPGIREAGYCLVDQELEQGLRSVAVPVFDAAGRIACSLNVSLPVAGDAETAEVAAARVLPALIEAATELGSALV